MDQVIGHFAARTASEACKAGFELHAERRG